MGETLPICCQEASWLDAFHIDGERPAFSDCMKMCVYPFTSTHICTVSSSDTHINHVNLQRKIIYTSLYTIYHCTHYSKYVFGQSWRGEHEVNSGCGIQRDWIFGGVALWTFCSSDQPLRKQCVPSGAGTGRLHLERYQVLKNKGMCFPFAADLSTEVFLLQSCKCFHPGCRQGVSNFLCSISVRFPLCHGLLIVSAEISVQYSKGEEIVSVHTC